jgi:SAM-dependent methyltransferase
MVQFVATDGERVVGWCDVAPRSWHGFRHSGVLGMGVVAEWRNQGIGSRLLQATLAAARAAGLSRIDLEVFRSNRGAIILYEKFGFVHEGVKRDARVLDDLRDDLLCMGLRFDAHPAPESHVTQAAATYIHGTEPSEQERLTALNRLTNAAFVAFLDVHPASKVLEIGSGLGLLARDVAHAAADVTVVGLEQSAAQTMAAVVDPRVRYVQGDAHRLHFGEGAFDLVYARYVLEHVADPTAVLREMRRVTRVGGRVAVCENDISLLRIDPECPAFSAVWTAFQEYQRDLGGDSGIGRRLHRLFKEVGFSDVQLSVQPEVHWHGSWGFDAWIQNIIGNVQSARLGLVESGRSSEAQIVAAIDELAALRVNAQASSQFMWNRAWAFR